MTEPKDQELVAWLGAQKTRLLEACKAAGLEGLSVGTPKDFPFGNWKYPCLVCAGDKPVARFWLSFRRLHKRSKIKVPRLVLETSPEIEQWLTKPPQPTSK